MTTDLPIVSVVGRPNVGKSTLVNRVLRRRAAVVEDVPGVTRDRVTYEAEWSGRRFTLIDTGGWDPTATGLMAGVAQQAELAVGLADVVLFVVDVRVGMTDVEEEVVRILQRSGRRVVVAANKADDPRTEAAAQELWSLGLGEPFPVSAIHGRGAGDLLDAVLASLPTDDAVAEDVDAGGPRRIAIVGKPNVGKSSLLNQLAGEQRVVVDSAAGTTVDPVDELVDIAGRSWRMIDTAGIRRRVGDASGYEYYASLRTQAAIERAEAVVVLIDASEPLTEQDLRILSMVADAGRALVLGLNKWDLVGPERRRWLEKELERQLVQLRWAPRVNLAARTGWHKDRIVHAVEQSLEGWETRVSTGELNAFLGRLVSAHPHPVRGGKQPKILFGTQPQSGPPKFLLFTSGFLEASYRRFVERRLREEYGFTGSPIQISLKVRERRATKKK